MKAGKRIDIYELVTPEIAHRGYGYSWLPLSAFKKGKQSPEFYFSKNGSCSWNMHIGISEYSFNKAYKKIGTIIIKKIHRPCQP